MNVRDASIDAWRKNRDAKVTRLLEPRTPAWLSNEKIDEEEQIIEFDLIHRWPVTGWARRRYVYDADVDVLHFRGETPISSAERAELSPEDRFDLRRRTGAP